MATFVAAGAGSEETKKGDVSGPAGPSSSSSSSPSVATDESLPSMGSRVRDAKGFSGTVRYVGPVLTSRNPHQSWVGVEWDDATRGKHDGMVVNEDGKEQRYYTCDMGKGSFIKPTKCNTGATLVSRALEKYGETLGERKQSGAPAPAGGAGAAAGDDKEEVNSFNTLKGTEVPVELVGVDMVNEAQALHKLVTVSLQGSDVAVEGPKGEVRAALPKLQDLNLDSNLLSDWEVVGRVGQELPRLTTLNLGRNRFMPLDTLGLPPTSSLVGAFPALKVLILNGTNIIWGEVQVRRVVLRRLCGPCYPLCCRRRGWGCERANN